MNYHQMKGGQFRVHENKTQSVLTITTSCDAVQLEGQQTSRQSFGSKGINGGGICKTLTGLQPNSGT